MQLCLVDDIHGDSIPNLAASESTPFNDGSKPRGLLLSGKAGWVLRVLDGESFGR